MIGGVSLGVLPTKKNGCAASDREPLQSDGVSTTQGDSPARPQPGGALSSMLASNPGVQEILREAKALSAALKCLGGPLSDEARTLIEGVLSDYAVTNAETQLIFCAMSRLLGLRRKTVPPPGNSPDIDRQVFEKTAGAWMAWAFQSERGRAMALAELKKLVLIVIETTEGAGGAIHLMALHPWIAAITALLENNHEEARRQYHRATEIGAQLGTETNPAIQWTYAATFIKVG